MILDRLRVLTKVLPTFLTAFLVAIAVWVLAVTSSDPSETRVYPNTVQVEVFGQSADLVIITDLPGTIAMTLRAPASIWNSLITEKAPVRALIDLSGMDEGDHVIPVQIQIGIKPVEIVSFNPRSVNLILESIRTKQFEIDVVARGALPVGYQAEEPQLSTSTATVSGARSVVERVTGVQAVIDLTEVKSDINQSVALQAVDESGNVVRDATVSPNSVTLMQLVAQRGGYRNVVVKVVTTGFVANGFRLTNISVFPPTVTVYSSIPGVVDELPGYVETKEIDLSGKELGFEESVDINLPENLQVIGTNQVVVNVGIEAIVSSLALTDVQVETTGLVSNLIAIVLPEKVNIIISGPLPLLETLFVSDLRVLVDLKGMLPGVYTLEPNVTLNIAGLKIESISPSSFEITISSK